MVYRNILPFSGKIKKNIEEKGSEMAHFWCITEEGNQVKCQTS